MKKLTSIIFLFFAFISILGYTQNADVEMQKLLKEKRIYNQGKSVEKGYRIQLYNGLSQTKAENIQGGFSALFPEVGTRLRYEQPEWKVQTVSFRTELEAYKIWLKIREEFAGTFIFDDK